MLQIVTTALRKMTFYLRKVTLSETQSYIALEQGETKLFL